MQIEVTPDDLQEIFDALAERRGRFLELTRKSPQLMTHFSVCAQRVDEVRGRLLAQSDEFP